MKLKMIVLFSQKINKAINHIGIFEKLLYFSTSHVYILNSQEPHKCSSNYARLIWVQSSFFFLLPKSRCAPYVYLCLGIVTEAYTTTSIVSFVSFFFFLRVGTNKVVGRPAETHIDTGVNGSLFVIRCRTISFSGKPNQVRIDARACREY